LGIHELASEVCQEEFSIRTLREAEDAHVDVVAAEGMAARAKAQAFAEEADGHVVAACAAISTKGDLMWPTTIDHSLVELAFAVDQGCLRRGLQTDPVGCISSRTKREQ